MRREHGGRLVEDEDLCAAVEGLEDLDPLLHTYRTDPRITRIRIDRQSVALGDLDDLGPRRLEVDDTWRGSARFPR